jgi:G3E family GTPase
VACFFGLIAQPTKSIPTMPSIPITIITGFLGSGKTTLLLNLIPQLPKDYKLALLKNEFGDVAIDSQLASSSAISGVQELLNDCICCNLVGQLGDALETLRKDVAPNRIVIETSGSAFPATLAMEVNRLGRESGHYILDGVIVVIDVENWKGYDDTSYTAKLQARYTDLIVFNKWENVSERMYEDCLDRVGDLELQSPNVKSDKGRVGKAVLLGLDSALAKTMAQESDMHVEKEHVHDHSLDHKNEVEVLSVTLSSETSMPQGVDLEALETFLLSAPKDEIYRIKAIVSASKPPTSSDGHAGAAVIYQGQVTADYILNWAFGRWTYSPMGTASPAAVNGSLVEAPVAENRKPILRMTIIFAKYEAEKWKKRIEAGGLVEREGEDGGTTLEVIRIT